MFTLFTCILLPYLLYNIYLTLGGTLLADIVIVVREGLQTVGGVIIVMCINYFYFVYSETAIVK